MGFLQDVATWLHDAGTDWASVIQAFSAVVTVIVAAIAVWIARQARDAETRQAQAALDALDVARKSDVGRQRETQILAMQPPMLISEPVPETTVGRYVSLRITVPNEYPAMALKAVRRRDGLDHAEVADLGARPAGSVFALQLPIAPFCEPPENTVPSGDPHELVVEYSGSLGQRVIERYEWFMGERIANRAGGASRWRLARYEVVITSPGGADGLDLTFTSARSPHGS